VPANRIRLREIDLSKAVEHSHPDIKVGYQHHYLALIRGDYHAGSFSKQWYGLNFDGWSYNPAGLQFDAPGWNASGWQRLWEIVG
jgi:hypothetical protein